MKKFLSLSLMFIMIICASQVMFASSALPSVGDVINGFKVVDRNYEKLFDAESVLFVHEKTGAEVIYLANDDINRAFDIGFKTPSLNDKGIPHVFEHATLGGSLKYPSQSLFFPLINQTYNTFVNAMTFTNFTVYLLASLSEDQLYLLSDYYLDSVFHPLIYEEERIFDREAWRYELSDKNAPLTLTGTVYNEMRGNQQIGNSAYFDLLDTLYPGSVIAKNSGGDPDVIPEMTYAELLDFHDKYYHPSNSLTFLYGDLDYVKFLGLLDDYFSQYEKSDIVVDAGIVEPLKELADEVYSFPVEKTSSTDGMTIVQYAVAVSDTAIEDLVGLQFLCEILNQESSFLKQEMKANLPKVNFSVSIAVDVPQPYIIFYAQGLEEKNKYIFKEIVDNSLEEIVSYGVNKDAAEAILRSQQLSNYMTTETSNLGTILSMNYYKMWASHDNFTYFNDFINASEMIAEELNNRYFENLIEKYLINNSHKALVATVPEPGMVEKKASELEAKLAAVKSSMSAQEIEALIAEGKDLAAWSQEEAPKEMLRSLQAVEVNSLPEEVKEYTIQDVTSSGVRLITAEAAAGGIGMTNILLDASSVKVEDIHYLYLYTSLLGNISTTKHLTSELSTLITRYLSGFSISIDAFEPDGKEFVPVVSTSWISLMTDYEKGVDLVKELIFDVDFSKIDEIKSYVSRMKTSYRTMINSNSYNVLLLRAYATSHDMYKFYSYASGLDFYQFLLDVEKQLDENPAAFIAKMESLKSNLANKDGSIVLFAGNGESTEIFKTNIGSFFGGFKNVKRTRADYSSIKSPSRSEAIVVDSTVQYNMLYASMEELGIKYNGGFLALGNLIYDAYLTPQIRHGLGAYDNLVLFSELGLTFISYRDPGVSATYEVYKGVGDFLESASFTQDDVDSYIISAYSSYAMPTGEINSAMSALGSYLEGEDPAEEKLKTMRELKALTVADVHKMNDVFDKMYSVGVRATSGGAAVIEENKERFLNIITPLASNEEESALTRGDVVRLFFGDLPEAMLMAVQAGVISGDGNGNYRENDLVTRQEFAIIIFRALGFEYSAGNVKISDLNKISTWARKEVSTLVEYGLLTLDEKGNFNPQNNVTMTDFDRFISQLMLLN